MDSKMFAPIPAEVERVGKIVLDAAYRVHTASVLGYWNPPIKPVTPTKFVKAVC